jgi:diguanylate cyclase (GGDEF)-like protein
MNINKLQLYELLSQIPWLEKSYFLKVMAIVGLGILIPLLTLTIHFATTGVPLGLEHRNSTLTIIFLATLASLVITFLLILWVLHPVILIANTLHHYLRENKLQSLPVRYTDSVGQLMRDVQYVIDKMTLLENSLQHHSNLDPLTGLLNHRGGEERLRQDVARAYRDEIQMLIAIVDIDQFKKVKEQFGTYVSDICLTQLVEAISRNIRKGDWVARWHENKFLIVLWNFNNISPVTVLERIQQQTIKVPMGELLQITLTVSAGEYNRGSSTLEPEQALEQLLIHLEQALTEGKEKSEGKIIFLH